MTKQAPAALTAIGAYLVLWGGSVGYLFATGGDWSTPIFVLAIFGVLLTGLGWLLTRGAEAPPIEVKRPALESTAVLIYIGLYAIFFLGYGMTAAREALPPGREQELLVVGLKLAVHVVLPALLLLVLGARLGPIAQLGLSGRKFWRTLIVLGGAILTVLCVISPSLSNIAELNAAPTLLAWAAPLSFLWITLEAGVCEEFLFRAVLQTRLTAWLRSPWTGVVITSVIFGLAHAPGLYLRGGPGVDGWSTDPLQVVAHSIATLAPVGLMFGLVYARTKSLLLVVLLHGLVDVLPNLPDFIRTWT